MAGRIGRYFVDYDVDMTLTPTMIAKTSSFQEEYGCEPRKEMTTREKLFSNRFESARQLKHTLKIGDIVNVNAEHRLYEILSSVNGRSFYQVRICTQPSCTCPDFIKQGSKVFYKHIFFVLMFALDVLVVTLSFQANSP